MPNSFLSVFLLAIEAQRVVALRLVLIAGGGAQAQAELTSMVCEKVDAAMEAAGTLLSGGTHGQVIARYRELVAANTERLSA